MKENIPAKKKESSDSLKVYFTFRSRKIKKGDVFSAFKKFGHILRCYLKHIESNSVIKKGYVKYKKLKDALSVQALPSIPCGDTRIFILADSSQYSYSCVYKGWKERDRMASI